jgi:hypothetical protein
MRQIRIARQGSDIIMIKMPEGIWHGSCIEPQQGHLLELPAAGGGECARCNSSTVIQKERGMGMFETASVNLCAPDLLSICGARESVNDQKRCRYYRKASRSERCMHFVEAIDGHCTSVEAQRNGRQ